MTSTTGSVPPRLTIERIETIPVRVPLDSVYRGSHYQMTHRSTVITRIHTAEGIVGEAYVGDEDHAALVARTSMARGDARRWDRTHGARCGIPGTWCC